MRYTAFFLLFLAIRAVAQQDSIPYIAHHTDDVIAIAYSPDSKFIVSAGWDESVIIQKNDSNAEVVQILPDFKGAVNTISFSRDGKNLIAGGQDGNIISYEIEAENFEIATRDTAFQLSNAPINKLIYGPGMRTVFCADNTGTFITYDLVKNKIIPIKGTSPITAAAVSVDRMSIFICYEGNTSITQFDPFGKLLKVYDGHTNDVTDLLATLDRKYLISSSKDKTVRIWEIATGKEITKLENHTWTVTDIDMDPFGSYLVSGGLDGVVNLYDLKTYALLRSQTFEGYKINAVAIAPNNTTIAVAAAQSGITNPAGFFMMNTYVPRRLTTAEKQVLIAKKKEERAAIKKAQQAGAKAVETQKPRTKTTTPAPVEPKNSGKLIEKTDQIEIRIDQSE